MMIAGRTWNGADGTEYKIVFAREVRHDQPRWWIDSPNVEEGDTMCGPATPARLHLIPASKISNEIAMALVMP